MTKQLVLLCMALICAVIPTLAATESIEQTARNFVLLIHRGEYQKAAGLFDNNMIEAVSEVQLKEIWESLVRQSGAFKKIEGTRSEAAGTYNVVFVTSQFEKQFLDVKVVFDKAAKVVGLFFVPVTTYHQPDYAKEGSFKEVEIQFGQEGWILPGTLSIPNGKGPFPAVVLVHGSGPHDRDETIGPNKPFRDLAWGLSSRGIAVLRYEKRTKQHAAKWARLREFTVQEETLADALEAVLLLQRREDIDHEHTFVLGHSLGGMLIPRVGMSKAKIGGFIVMAGCARPLEDLILEQTLYQASLATSLTAEAKAQIEAVRKQVSAVKALDRTNASAMTLLGFPCSFWLDLKDYRPHEEAEKILAPMLVLQGEKDCQVSAAKDFQAWHSTLSKRDNVKFRLYKELNHLFMETEGKSTGAEYQQPNNVDATVINDIADWVSKGK